MGKPKKNAFALLNQAATKLLRGECPHSGGCRHISYIKRKREGAVGLLNDDSDVVESLLERHSGLFVRVVNDPKEWNDDREIVVILGTTRRIVNGKLHGPSRRTKKAQTQTHPVGVVPTNA